MTGQPNVWPRQPRSGLASSSLSIGRMARNTGHQAWIFQGLLMRIPIRNTTKSPSTSAVMRCGIIARAMGTSPVADERPASLLMWPRNDGARRLQSRHAGVQDRGTAAAHLLEAALDRGRNLRRIADLLAIGAERLADLGEVDIHRKCGLELVLGLGLAVRVDPQRRFLHRRPAAVVEHDGEDRQLVLFGYRENRVCDVEVEAAVAHDLDCHVLRARELGAERHAA